MSDEAEPRIFLETRDRQTMEAALHSIIVAHPTHGRTICVEVQKRLLPVVSPTR